MCAEHRAYASLVCPHSSPVRTWPHDTEGERSFRAGTGDARRAHVTAGPVLCATVWAASAARPPPRGVRLGPRRPPGRAFCPALRVCPREGHTWPRRSGRSANATPSRRRPWTAPRQAARPAGSWDLCVLVREQTGHKGGVRSRLSHSPWVNAQHKAKEPMSPLPGVAAGDFTANGTQRLSHANATAGWPRPEDEGLPKRTPLFTKLSAWMWAQRWGRPEAHGDSSGHTSALSAPGQQHRYSKN